MPTELFVSVIVEANRLVLDVDLMGSEACRGRRGHTVRYSIRTVGAALVRMARVRTSKTKKGWKIIVMIWGATVDSDDGYTVKELQAVLQKSSGTLLYWQDEVVHWNMSQCW